MFQFALQEVLVIIVYHLKKKINNRSLDLTICNYFGELTCWKNFCGWRSHAELNPGYVKWTLCTLQWKFSHVSWDFVAFCSSDGCVVSEYDSSVFRNLRYIELLLKSLHFCGILFCCQLFVAKTCTVSGCEMVSHQRVSVQRSVYLQRWL